MKTRNVATAMFMSVALAGCSAGGGRYADLAEARPAVGGLTGRTCHYLARPAVPASLDRLSRPGTRGSIILWGRDAAPSDTIDVSVRYGQDGRLEWARAIRSGAPADRVAELERLLFESLTEKGPEDWGLRIRVVGGSVAALLPSVICPSERGDRVGQAMGPMGSPWEVQEALRVRTRRVEVEVDLDAAGRILDVRVSRGSGSRVLDQHAMDVARTYRYYPKLHDGIGVPSTHRLPLRPSRR